LPLSEYLKDSLLGILVLDGRALRTFKPADNVFHLVFYPRRSGGSHLPRANLPPTRCDRQFRECAASRDFGTSIDCGRPARIQRPAWDLSARRAGDGTIDSSVVEQG